MMGKPRILLVDDDLKNLKILQLSLRGGWEIQAASTGEEAVAIAQSFVPDLVLLDIMMPGMNGYEVCLKLRADERLRFAKIILISARALIEERMAGYSVGADDYMVKPYMPEELEAKVKVYLRLTSAEKQLYLANSVLELQVEERTRELKLAQSQLVYSAKMSALGEMSGGLAHEINTPLATMTLLLEQIKESVENNSISTELTLGGIKTLLATTDRISKIVQGLRIFARESSNDSYQMANLKELLESSLSLCQERLKLAQMKLELDFVGDDFGVCCRPSEITQIILNLMNNAIDAKGEGGEGWIKVSLRQRGKEVLLTITDNGIGVSDEIQERIFQPFFTTKPMGKGTGLGLSISKGFAQAHGGELSFVESQDGGTTFQLKLPYAKG